jgi:ribose-phosphate pyrophosphokinase
MSPAVAVLAGDAHPALAARIASLCGARLLPCPVSAFADGETRVRIDADLRDADLHIVQPTCAPTSERLMTLALMAEAARAAGAARVTALVPYFGYARQDVRKQPGEPRSAQLAARLLAAAGVDRMVVLELHSPALESAFPMPLTHLLADDALLPAVRVWALPAPTIVSPDAGGLKRAQRCAAALGAPLAVLAKTRPRPDVALALEVLGEVRGRDCLILDDMASTGGTIVAAAAALRAAGAREVHALFVHAVLAPGALERIGAQRLGRVATTDSVPLAAGAPLEVIGIAPLLAAALERLAAR